ncbi:MAG: PD40 domain-containing protein [Anaerolineales bacterium]|nr:PD40 domain-containing protein [Anaerolineales bacterium]
MKNATTAVFMLIVLFLTGCSAGQTATDPADTAGVPASPTPAAVSEPPEPGFAPILTPTLTFTPIPPTATPEKLANLALSVAAGGSHTCAITKRNGLSCWGNNEHGQLGDGTVTDSSRPVEVAGLSGGVKAVALGWGHTCAVTLKGAVKCWGYNKNGELGNGLTADSATPVDVESLGSGVTAIAAGDDHTCAVTGGGGVKCWGYNAYGQLGDGTTESRAFPVDVAGVTGGATAVAAGWGHTCLLTIRGGVMCWGNNEGGQLGNGRPEPMRFKIADVSGLTAGVSAIAAHGGHTCAMTAEGGLKCWGYNKYGQLGDGTSENRNLPAAVNRIGQVVAVALGSNHTCALARDIAACWGDNFTGQLGDGTQTTHPEPVPVAEDLIAIAAGGAHTCAVTAGGGVRCWGSNSAGQLGDGTTSNRNAPVYAVGWDEWILELGGLDAQTGIVTALAFSPDGKLLASGGTDGKLLMWDTAAGERLFAVQYDLVEIIHLSFSPDGSMLASVRADGKIIFLNSSDGRMIRSLDGLYWGVVSPDWKTVAYVLRDDCGDFSLRLFDLAEGKDRYDLGACREWLAFSPDGKMLACGVVAGNIRLWDTATGGLLSSLTGEMGYSGPLSFSPDGKWIAAATDRNSQGGGFGLWSVEQGKEVLVLQGRVSSVIFSGDGNILISGSYDGMLKFWDAATGRLLRTLRQTTERDAYGWSSEGIASLALSADGELLAAGLINGSVRWWRISTPPAS